MSRHDALRQFSHLCLDSSPAARDARSIRSGKDISLPRSGWFARAIALVVPPTCTICASACDVDQNLCDRCAGGLARSALGIDIRARTGALNRLFAAHDYSGIVQDAIKALKYSGRTLMAETIAELIVSRLPEGLISTESVLVPVPAHPANQRSRGFNQSLLIANSLGAQLNVPVLDCLVREGRRRPQSQLSRKQRLQLPREEFVLARQRERKSLVEFPTNVVVCDDVTTTTCTLEACASAIRERHSVQTIHGLAFASASL